MTNTALKSLVSQTQASAKVCETWFGRVIIPLEMHFRASVKFHYSIICGIEHSLPNQ